MTLLTWQRQPSHRQHSHFQLHNTGCKGLSLKGGNPFHYSFKGGKNAYKCIRCHAIIHKSVLRPEFGSTQQRCQDKKDKRKIGRLVYLCTQFTPVTTQTFPSKCLKGSRKVSAHRWQLAPATKHALWNLRWTTAGRRTWTLELSWESKGPPPMPPPQ